MYERETVFILGAGASWHYGYPTGEKLVTMVIKKAKDLEKIWGKLITSPPPGYFSDRFINLNPSAGDSPSSLTKVWEFAIQECNNLASMLEQHNPLVIDYFLDWHEKLQGIGNLLIAWVILECEAQCREGYNINRRDLPNSTNDWRESKHWRQHDDWLRFIIHEMLSKCKNIDEFLAGNHITFVTFNYDVSLEQNLSKRLCSLELFSGHERAIKDFIKNRVVHVYGQIRPYSNIHDPVEIFKPNVSASDYDRQLAQIEQAAQAEIFTINGVDKRKQENAFARAQEIISRAQDIFILGYGFDATNSDRIRLQKAIDSDKHFIDPSRTDRKIFYTNKNNSNKVNKAAANVLSDNPEKFLAEPAFQYKYPRTKSSGVYKDHTFFVTIEKSIKDVYQALAYDFD